MEHILDKADGSPLFVEELTRAVIESGQLAERDDRFELHRAAARAGGPEHASPLVDLAFGQARKSKTRRSNRSGDRDGNFRATC